MVPLSSVVCCSQHTTVGCLQSRRNGPVGRDTVRLPFGANFPFVRIAAHGKPWTGASENTQESPTGSRMPPVIRVECTDFSPVAGARSVERPLLCETYVEFLQRQIHELLFQPMVIRSTS